MIAVHRLTPTGMLRSMITAPAPTGEKRKIPDFLDILGVAA
ncbi:hypothetical protein SPDO_14360 [Sphingomonas dokdonensis]|uniref:Uncharacterized protein n=1 Tax=Sphingomonas dokdonensis TaxID=344880 RepID=A0A245ZNW5_9SPHN|nr:hypothetical protein SPDO_14360 [Sphingomonas dokdonensis]